jgi:hypothetical protein
MGGTTYSNTNALEDQKIDANVQLGLESRDYDRGPLVLRPGEASENESAVAYFSDTLPRDYCRTVRAASVRNAGTSRLGRAR